MRADRLISLLMLLQARGRLTARALADELEVSERTIYRDIEALSIAGVPVYAERGPGGGCALLDSYRTTLTGLNEAEVRALFMLGAALAPTLPGPLAALGGEKEMKAALRKLSAALPEAQRLHENRVRQRFYVDWTWWFQAVEPVPHLRTLQAAVWNDRRLRLSTRSPFGGIVERTVDPLGLVAKAGVWYLVYRREGHLRARRVSRLVDARLTEEPFERPADFDLPTFWKSWCAEFEESRPSYPVRARLSPDLAARLPQYFGSRAHELLDRAAPPDGEGWITLELPFETFEAARERLLGFGRAVEVLEPLPLRLSLIDFAKQVVSFYAEKEG